MWVQWSLNLNLRIRKPLMQTRGRVALCPWAFSLWGGQSTAMWVRASNREGGEGGRGQHSPTAGGASRGPWAPSCVGENPSRRTLGESQASIHTRQKGRRKGCGSATLGGEDVCTANTLLARRIRNGFIVTIVMFSPNEESSLCQCRGVQPVPVQHLRPNPLAHCGWPGALGVARLLHY